MLRLGWDGHTLGAAALSVLARQREEGEQTVQTEAGRLQECLLTDPALVLPSAGPAVEVALLALQDGALDDLAAGRAGDLPDQVLQQHQASAGDLVTWPRYITLSQLYRMTGGAGSCLLSGIY